MSPQTPNGPNLGSNDATIAVDDKSLEPSKINGSVSKDIVDQPNKASKETEGKERSKGKTKGISATSHEADADSELSEPASVPNSPPQAADEIVVNDISNGDEQSFRRDREATEDEDEPMADADAPSTTPVVSPYPKRKRTSTYARLNDDEHADLYSSKPGTNGKPKPRVGRPPRQGASGGKSVAVGHWRDSPVPDESRKHMVIGFIDIRDRLRTRIQGHNLLGEQVSNVWPLPPRTGASWVTFDGIYFLPHLVGLDQLQVKEYVRIRLDAPDLETDEEREAAEKAAVEQAIKTVRKASMAAETMSAGPPPPIAYGAELPVSMKRRRTSRGYSPTGATNGSAKEPVVEQQPLDPLEGTRPTKILVGCWNKSDAAKREDRHAVYGILGANDMFRVKLVRETRSGEFKDDNFPQGAGALWISYDEVDFDDHLQNLTRSEIKEYCRVRQYQIDQGENPKDRINNETKAVYEAQARAGVTVQPAKPANMGIDYSNAQNGETQNAESRTTSRTGFGGQELRSSRRVEAMTRNQQQQQQPTSPPKVTTRQERAEQANGRASDSGVRTPNGQHSTAALNRTGALAQRELSRAEAAQGRADLHASHKERAAQAAAQAADAAAAINTPSGPSALLNGNSRFYESDSMRRLNDIWARQESRRARAGGEDAKIYDGIKYERKTTGPLMGKLTSHGQLITIDGEDYVEYRVLTKPSFF